MKPLRISLQAVLFLVICGIALFSIYGSPKVDAADVTFPVGQLTLESKSGAHIFQVEIATSMMQRSQGLMFRDSLAMDKGMLFDFGGEQPVDMWMKNTRIPLDMLFINEKQVITHIAENAVPYSLDIISSGGEVRYVLELAGGAVKHYQLEVGDKMTVSQ